MRKRFRDKPTRKEVIELRRATVKEFFKMCVVRERGAYTFANSLYKRFCSEFGKELMTPDSFGCHFCRLAKAPIRNIRDGSTVNRAYLDIKLV